MRFEFFLLSTVLSLCFVGSAFAQTVGLEKDFTQEEIDEMKNKAVLLTLNDGTMLIEFYPEEAPNTVYNFLNLVGSGYYDGVVFHRIIPNFMIQAGDPQTKDPTIDRSMWGQGGPGYNINEEFNTLQHDRGIVSMARSSHPDSAGSQFFIVHQDSNFLDAEYTAFGRLVPGTHSIRALDIVASLETDAKDAPLDQAKATIIKAEILDPYTPSSVIGIPEPDRNDSILKQIDLRGGKTDVYYNYVHDVKFHLPYRWSLTETPGEYFNALVEPTLKEHSVQAAIAKSGFTPQVLVFTEERSLTQEGTELNTAFFSLRGGEKPKVLSNYIFENTDGKKAHLMITTQDVETSTETAQFKMLQLHFTNSDLNYSIIYVNLTDWFRYEVNAFHQVVKSFEVSVDGELKPMEFGDSPVYQQVIADAREKPIPEPLPPARIGGCLIATATYGSEMAPQVQFLREVRDNTVLQTESGKTFMKGFNQFYYSFSPTIADYERENFVFKEAVKLTLTPLLVSLTLLQYTDIDSEHEMLGYGIGLILLNIGMYFVAPAVLITKIRSFYKLQ